MKRTLAIKGLIKLLSGLILMSILLFLPAGTIHYPGAWRMIGVLFVPMFIFGMALLFLKPQLLEKRLNQKEEEKEQKLVILFSSIIFIASFVLCGLDFRFAWSHVPYALSVIGCLVFILTYIAFGELLRENEYLSRTVEVQENQKVVSTGLYGIVRHPMYAIIFWMFFSMPIIIGSFIGLIPMIFIPAVLIKRIQNEEKVLKENLEGYEQYTRIIKYRLIPYVW